MAFVVLLVAGLGLGLGASAVARRMGRPGSSAGVGQFDYARVTLAVLAAFLAAGVALLTLADRTIETPAGAIVLVADAVAAGVLSAYPSRRVWGSRRRLAAAAVGVAWVTVGVVVLPFAVAVSACACASTGPAYVAPSILGMDARAWIVVADIVGPLLLIAASAPGIDRLYGRRPEPRSAHG